LAIRALRLEDRAIGGASSDATRYEPLSRTVVEPDRLYDAAGVEQLLPSGVSQCSPRDWRGIDGGSLRKGAQSAGVVGTGNFGVWWTVDPVVSGHEGRDVSS